MSKTIEKHNELLYSGSNDECYTPHYGVTPILKYIPRDWVVWCPFDTMESEFVKQISATNKVLVSHINNNQDFYLYEPKEHWDVIISNPPFSGKRQIFERALSFNKPFALLMTNTWLNDAAPIHLFKDRGLQLLMVDKRIEFINPTKDKIGRPTFSSSYFCCDFLPKQIIMENIKIK